MTVTFFSNFLNHHQVHLADEMYNSLGANYRFVAIEELPSEFKNNGYPDYSDRTYLLKATTPENRAIAMKLAEESDVVIIGSAPEMYIKKRLKQNKLTFRYNERWFKENYRKLLRPHAWRNYYRRHIRYRNKNLYMLCASAFTASDVAKVFAYPNKCYKWGYFTQVSQFDFDKVYAQKQDSTLHLMWCARFIDWKHPEMVVQLAKQLKESNYHIVIDMFGNGEMLEYTQQLARDLEVDDIIRFRRSIPNGQILEEMRKHDIFLFTSDRNEGWGAVLNEAMSNGCVAVASDEIGSAPFLIKHRENGLLFKSKSLDSLYESVKYLIDNPQERHRMSKNAYETMLNIWSPKNAATRVLQLFKGLLDGEPVEFSDGPCSKA